MATEGRQLLSPLIRFSYPNLIKPKKALDENGKPTGDPIFSITMLIPKSDISKFLMTVEGKEGFQEVTLPTILQEVAKEEWPSETMESLFPQSKKHAFKRVGWPLIDGDLLAKALQAKGKTGAGVEANVGHYVMALKSKQEFPPKISHRVSGKLVRFDRDNEGDMRTAGGLFVGGNYGRIEFKVGAALVNERNYLTGYINNVLFAKEGEKFGGESMMDRFAGLDGGESDFDPTEGNSGTAGFGF